MFSKFRKLYAAPDLPLLTDPVFGRIFNEGCFWWGSMDFPGNPRQIELIIPAAGAGPEEWRRELFLQIRDRYPLICSQVLAAASNAVEENLSQDLLRRFQLLSPDDKERSFLLESITLPEVENGSWEATYSNSITEMKYTVTIDAWAVTQIHQDS